MKSNEDVKLPEGYDNSIKQVIAYHMDWYNDVMTVAFYYDTYFSDYNLKLGMDEAIGNMIYMMEGEKLLMEYIYSNNKIDDLVIKGSFKIAKKSYLIYDYGYWNEDGRVVMFANFDGDSD